MVWMDNKVFNSAIIVNKSKLDKYEKSCRQIQALLEHISSFLMGQSTNQPQIQDDAQENALDNNLLFDYSRTAGAITL